MYDESFYVSDTEKTNVRPSAKVTKWPYPLRPMSEFCKEADLTQIGVEQHIATGKVFKEVILRFVLL